MLSEFKVYQKNFILNIYTETTKVYVANNGVTRQPIKFTVNAEVVTPWKISYSIDSGSTWTDIITGLTDPEYIWTPSDAFYNAVLNGSPSYDARAITFRAVDDTPTTLTVDGSIFKTSLTTANITPNHEITECYSSNDGEQQTFSMHNDPIYKQDATIFAVNEIWDSELQFFDIYLEDSANPGTYIHLIHQGTAKARTATWVFDANKTWGGTTQDGPVLSTLLGPQATVRLHFISQDIHCGNYAVGTWFAYTANPMAQFGDASGQANYASRTDMFGRIGIEKGIFLDEAIPVAQLEAGDGIIIAQRNASGQRVSELGTTEQEDVNTVDLSKAYNLVIQSKITEIPDAPRHKKGWFEVLETNPLTPRADGLTDDINTWRTGTYCMGSVFQYDIVHNWNLTGEHQGNFRLDVYNVTNNTHFTKPKAEMIPMWESIGANTIRVYVVIKDDSAYQPTIGKDQVVFDVNEKSRWFFYQLTEVMPESPMLTIEGDPVIGQTSMTLEGEVISIGNSPVTERGFCWSLGNPPNINDDQKLICGKGKGTFTGTIGTLTANMNYYINAYAVNEKGQVGYSAAILKKTLA